MKEFRQAFVWYYFDHYLNERDPYGRFGYNAERMVAIHIKLSGKNFESEFLHFILNARIYQHHYDMLASFDYEKVKFEMENEIKIENISTDFWSMKNDTPAGVQGALESMKKLMTIPSGKY
jgi:hypothetical protein